MSLRQVSLLVRFCIVNKTISITFVLTRCEITKNCIDLLAIITLARARTQLLASHGRLTRHVELVLCDGVNARGHCLDFNRVRYMHVMYSCKN